MLNHPYMTNALVEARQHELHADAVVTRRAKAPAQAAEPEEPRLTGLRAIAVALLGVPRTAAVRAPCDDTCP